MKRLIKLGILGLVLLILVFSWGDKFRASEDNSFFYLENYRQIRQGYLDQGPEYLAQEDLELWNLKQAARQVQDYDFLIYILKDLDQGPSALEENQVELLEVLLEAGYYDQAQKLGLELLDQEKAYEEMYSRPRLGIRTQEIYKGLIDLYSQLDRQEDMEKIYYEIREKYDLTKLIGEDNLGGQKNFIYLDKLIVTSKNPKIRNEIIGDILEAPLSINAIIFIARQEEATSPALALALDRAKVLVEKSPKENRDLAAFLDLVPSITLKSLLDYQEPILLLDGGKDLKLIYLDPYDRPALLAEKQVLYPASYEAFYTRGLMMNRQGTSLVLAYDSYYLIQEFVDGKILDLDLGLDYTLDQEQLKSKKLGQALELKGTYKSKALYMEDDLIYELLRFYQDGSLASVILNQYELDQGGYIELIKMERIF